MEPLTVAARLESLATIGRYVLDAAAAAGLDARASYRLRLAVDEIATNIVMHGHAEGSRKGQVEVRVHLDDRRLTVLVEDAGPAYDPRVQPHPEHLERPLDERPEGGLGVFLALRGVDEFRYERAGDWNRNIFVMRRPRPGGWTRP
jgi:serine/threonine-protein kinase RsbW